MKISKVNAIPKFPNRLAAGEENNQEHFLYERRKLKLSFNNDTDKYPWWVIISSLFNENIIQGSIYVMAGLNLI